MYRRLTTSSWPEPSIAQLRNNQHFPALLASRGFEATLTHDRLNTTAAVAGAEHLDPAPPVAGVLMDTKGDFYCRYYVGHKGKFGHEFLEFEFTSSGLVQLLVVPLLLRVLPATVGLPSVVSAAAICKQLKLQKRYYDQEGSASQQNSLD